MIAYVYNEAQFSDGTVLGVGTMVELGDQDDQLTLLTGSPMYELAKLEAKRNEYPICIGVLDAVWDGLKVKGNITYPDDLRVDVEGVITEQNGQIFLENEYQFIPIRYVHDLEVEV